MIDNLFHKYYDYIQEKENNYIDFTKRGGHILKCVLISLILVSIVANDFYNGKVSNWLILIGMILGIAVRMQEQGAYGMLVFVGGFVGTACCLFLFFLLKMFGAGDIKVLAVLGGWYGISFSITCFVYSIFIGGEFDYARNGFVGNMCDEFLQRFHFDLAFLGVVGIDLESKSVMTYMPNDGQTKRIVLKQSKKAYMLADSDKFYQMGNYEYAKVDAFYGILQTIKSNKK